MNIDKVTKMIKGISEGRFAKLAIDDAELVDRYVQRSQNAGAFKDLDAEEIHKKKKLLETEASTEAGLAMLRAENQGGEALVAMLDPAFTATPGPARNVLENIRAIRDDKLYTHELLKKRSIPQAEGFER